MREQAYMHSNLITTTGSYCFGGACAARLGAKSLVDSIVIVHPGGLSLKDVGPIRVRLAVLANHILTDLVQVPTSWANAEGCVIHSNAHV